MFIASADLDLDPVGLEFAVVETCSAAHDSEHGHHAFASSLVLHESSDVVEQRSAGGADEAGEVPLTADTPTAELFARGRDGY